MIATRLSRGPRVKRSKRCDTPKWNLHVACFFLLKQCVTVLEFIIQFRESLLKKRSKMGRCIEAKSLYIPMDCDPEHQFSVDEL